MEDQKEYKFIGYFPNETEENQLEEQHYPPVSWLTCIDPTELQNLRRTITNTSLVQNMPINVPLRTDIENPTEISHHVHSGVQSKKLFNNKIRVNQEFPQYGGYYRPYCTCFIPSPETEYALNRRKKEHEESERAIFKRRSGSHERRQRSPLPEGSSHHRSPDRKRANKRSRSLTPECQHCHKSRRSKY